MEWGAGVHLLFLSARLSHGFSQLQIPQVCLSVSCFLPPFTYLTFFSVVTSIPPTFSVNSLFQYTQCCLPFVQILAFCHGSLSNWYLKSTFWLSPLTSLTALSLTLFFCHLSLLSPCSFHFKLLLSRLSVLCPAFHVLLSHDMSHFFSYSFCAPLCIFLHIRKVFIWHGWRCFCLSFSKDGNQPVAR